MPFATNTVINTNIMAINGYGSIWMIVVFVILCIGISNIFIYIGKKKFYIGFFFILIKFAN